MLLPNVCIIWDKETVRDRWRLRDDGAAYVDYVSKKWHELDSITADFTKNAKRAGDPTRTIEKQHVRYLAGIGFEGVSEPISKLLDECNYPLSWTTE